MGIFSRVLVTSLMALSFTQVTFAADSCKEIWNDILSEGELPQLYQPLVGLCGDQFRNELRRVISTNRDLGYKGARQAFFTRVDNVNGVVCCVYTGRCIKTNRIPNPNDMNCEHTWPQSKGAKGIAKADLNHLFPADSKMNSRRSNYPFCEVAKAQFEGQGNKLGRSDRGTKCFEPTDNHKGDVARAMMYFSVRYNKAIDEEQEEFFRKWMIDDPVSEKEVVRNSAVQAEQGNRNPFIDYPQFADLIENF